MSHEKMNGGMHVLNHAAKNKGLKVQKLISEKYSDFVQAIESAALQNKKALNRAKEKTQDAIYDGSEKIKSTAVQANKKVRKNPWAFIGGTALGALFVGFLLGKTSKK